MPNRQPICGLAHAFSVPVALSRTFDIPAVACSAPFAAYLSSCHHRRASSASSALKRHDRYDIKPESLADTLAAHRASNRASLVRSVPSDRRDPDTKRREEIEFRYFLDEADPGELRVPRKHGLDPHVRPFDYEGEYRAPRGSAAPEESLPWLSGIDGSKHRLDSEIKSFAAYLRPSDGEHAARFRVIEEISGLLNRSQGKRLLPNRAFLQAFGSQVNGLALANSDIDLNVWVNKPDAQDVQPGLRTLRNPRWLLKNFHERWLLPHKDWILVAYRELRFPLITAQHRLSGIDIQIVGAPSTANAQASVAHYLKKFPTLRDVFAVVRQMLDARGFLDVYKGGMGSYSVFNMVVASYLHNPSEEKEGARVLAFLEFWAKHDLYGSCVSIDPPLIFPKIRKTGLTSTERKNMDQAAQYRLKLANNKKGWPYLLVLQDPADPGNDLGKKTGAIKHIQKTIMGVQEELRKRLLDEREYPSLLAPLVGTSFDQIEARREKVREYLKGGRRRDIKTVSSSASSQLSGSNVPRALEE